MNNEILDSEITKRKRRVRSERQRRRRNSRRLRGRPRTSNNRRMRKLWLDGVAMTYHASTREDAEQIGLNLNVTVFFDSLGNSDGQASSSSVCECSRDTLVVGADPFKRVVDRSENREILNYPQFRDVICAHIPTGVRSSSRRTFDDKDESSEESSEESSGDLYEDLELELSCPESLN